MKLGACRMLTTPSFFHLIYSHVVEFVDVDVRYSILSDMELGQYKAVKRCASGAASSVIYSPKGQQPLD